MANRSAGFGMSADIKKKLDSKYDHEREKEARDFIKEHTGETVDEGPSGVHTSLKDGVILLKLAEKLFGAKVKVNSSKLAFKMMENIGNFLKACGDFGVQSSDLFQTVDLYEAQNINQVINTILAIKNKVTGKEATRNERNFTEEQLKAGGNIIGLQMGSNKGASQAGDHFGRPRQVAGANVYK